MDHQVTVSSVKHQRDEFPYGSRLIDRDPQQPDGIAAIQPRVLDP